VAAHAQNSPLAVYFFLRTAVDQPVGPTEAANGSNEASWRRTHFYMFSIKIFKIYPFLCPNFFENLHYGLWELQNGITRSS